MEGGGGWRRAAGASDKVKLYMSASNHFVEVFGHIWMYKERRIRRVNKCCMLQLFKYSGVCLLNYVCWKSRCELLLGVFIYFSTWLWGYWMPVHFTFLNKQVTNWLICPTSCHLNAADYNCNPIICFSTLDTDAEWKSWRRNWRFVRLFALAGCFPETMAYTAYSKTRE